MYPLQSLFNYHESPSSLIYKILSGGFLLPGGLAGVFFLFQALIPFIGYLESAAVACGILIIFGIGLLLIAQQRKASSSEKIIQKAAVSCKDIPIENLLRNNALPLSLLCLVIGIVLSQVKSVNSLSEIFKRCLKENLFVLIVFYLQLLVPHKPTLLKLTKYC